MSSEPTHTTVTEYLLGLIDDRLDSRLSGDDFTTYLTNLIDDRIATQVNGDDLSEAEVKTAVREVLEEEAVVYYGGDVGLRTYDDGVDTTTQEQSTEDTEPDVEPTEG